MRNLFIFSALVLGLSACYKEVEIVSLPYDKGVIVINEGNFFDNNGSLDQMPFSGTGIVNDIFQKENVRSIAGNISGYTEVNKKGIILVDNSTAGKDAIEIVNAGTFKSIMTIAGTEIENPRAVLKVGENKAYVSCWGVTGNFPDTYKNPGYVAVIDLLNNKVMKKITVQKGPETMQLIGNYVFVGNTFSNEQKITAIDITKDEAASITTLDFNPEMIGVDANSKLWVMAGDQFYKLGVSLDKLTTEAKLPITTTKKDRNPYKATMSADKKSIFYKYSFFDENDDYKEKGEIYNFNINDAKVTTDKVFIKKSFGGGFGVDPGNGNIYAGLIPSYKQAGYVFRYKADGTLIDSTKAGIAPSRFFFKK